MPCNATVPSDLIQSDPNPSYALGADLAWHTAPQIAVAFTFFPHFVPVRPPSFPDAHATPPSFPTQNATPPSFPDANATRHERECPGSRTRSQGRFSRSSSRSGPTSGTNASGRAA
eukprot:3000119-Rhodomonas_salina.1